MGNSHKDVSFSQKLDMKLSSNVPPSTPLLPEEPWDDGEKCIPNIFLKSFDNVQTS